MKQRAWSILAIGALLVGGYWWISYSEQTNAGQETASNETKEPVATVKVAPVLKGSVVEEIEIYGTVVPAAGAVQIFSVPYESRVRHIFVAEAQRISRGDNLFEIEPSPETSLQAQQARNEYDSAKKALDYMQQRFDLKLSTNDQLLQTRQALDQAEAKLASMQHRGSESPRTIRASESGLVSKVSAQEGAIIAAGTPMLEMVPQNRLEVRLGVEPQYIEKIKLGQEVSLARVNGAGNKLPVRIRKISGAADPTTRLIQVFGDLPSSSTFLLGEYVLGKIAVASVQGLIVPRSAVLPSEDHYVLFTVKDGHVQKHTVDVGLENENDAEVVAIGLHAGEQVVSLGNYELKDGMAVKTVTVDTR